jgi:hypothetical protein
MSELNISINLEKERRDGMYEDLCQTFGEKSVNETLEAQIIKHITQMYDNKEELQKMEEEDGNI